MCLYIFTFTFTFTFTFIFTFAFAFPFPFTFTYAYAYTLLLMFYIFKGGKSKMYYVLDKSNPWSNPGFSDVASSACGAYGWSSGAGRAGNRVCDCYCRMRQECECRTMPGRATSCMTERSLSLVFSPFMFICRKRTHCVERANS